MRQVVIAFATTGKDPKAGARISELAAIEQEDGKPTGRTLHLNFGTSAASEGGTFAQQFDVLDNLIGDAKIVVFRAALWRKFLRPELRHVRGRGSRRLLTQTVDVSQWARARFPKQRNDLTALARKVGVDFARNLVGLINEVETLSAVNAKISTSSDVIEPAPASMENPASSVTSPTSTRQRSFAERLALCWRVLVGQA